MFSFLLNILKGLLFPRTSCDIHALLNAVARGNVPEFREILANSNPDLRLDDGSTLLINVAVSQFMNNTARIEMTRALHEAGATIDLSDKEGTTPLMFAVGGGEEAFCRLLIELGGSLIKADRNGDTVLIWAASTNKLPSLQFLIEAGADVNHRSRFGRTALMYAARHGNMRYLEQLLAAGADSAIVDREGTSALSAACSMGRCEAATLLVDKNPSLKKTLSLHDAASVGYLDIMAQRLEQPELLLRKNQNGFTPIELAVMYRQRAALVLLLPHYQTNPDIKGAALATGALTGADDLIGLLLEHGADPNWVDTVGDSALMFAATRNHAAAAALLLRYGADKRLKNKQGEDAQYLAQKHKAYEVLQVLFKAN